MANLDMKKTLKQLYAPSTNAVSVVAVPPLPYLMIDGQGNPNTSTQYQQAVQALYGLAYGIRAIAKAGGDAFTVMPLEGLWTLGSEQPAGLTLTEADKDRFTWTMMIMQPDFVTTEMVEQARTAVAEKKSDLTLLGAIRFETYHEGEAVQIMHIGSYNDEGPNIARLHQHIADNGWTLSGTHHEIYLSDPRKTEPDKLKTVIRQPFSRT